MADIRNLSVLPRPRSAWQAIDAGFTLARAHYVQLVMMWLGFSIPLFTLCFLLQLWFGWGFTIMFWWWFKPLYELPMLFYLSKAVFSESLSVRQTWALTRTHFWTLFKTYLTLARFSTSRALSYSVVFLEMLPPAQRYDRIQTLCSVKTRHYVLMMACLHVEYIMTYAIITFLAVMFFSSSLADMQWSLFLEANEDPTVKMWMLAASVITFASAALVAPFYVAGGFLIYINRRMQLEAWDIEHRFRNIKPRTLKSTVITSFFLIAILMSTSSDPAIAQERSQTIMSPASASIAINEILSGSEFGSTKTRTVPALKDRKRKKEADNELESSFFKWFADAASSLAIGFKVILWAIVAIFIGLLVYTLSKFRPSLATPNTLARHRSDDEDVHSHPLTQDLPTNIVATAERLLANGERRQALSVLFRGALRSVMKEHELKIATGATEKDCQRSIATVASDLQTQTFSNLLGVWQKEAYGNQTQSEETIRSLINEWKYAFAIPPKAKNVTAAS